MSLNKISINDTTTVNTGIVYDITKATSQSYDSLSAALGTDGNNVPLEIREGGMSVRFVHTGDNNYVQYRLKASVFSISEKNWQPCYESSDSIFDFSISDEVGNDIARFTNGHLRTKNFDSEIAQNKIYQSESKLNTIEPGAEVNDINIGNSTQFGDLTLEDEKGNSIVEFSDGHLRTKNFDSERLLIKNILMNLFDFSIDDNDGNSIIRFINGHIKTKNFNSESVVEDVEELKRISVNLGKHFGSFSVLGDSYSTFRGYTTPDEALQWYPDSSQHISGNNDVVEPTQQWWHLFANEYKSLLKDNISWSAAPISYDGWGTGTSDGKSISFITRANTYLTAETKPELLLVFGGTNDAWIGVNVGENQYSDWTDDDLCSFRPALCKLMYDLTTKKEYIGMQVVMMWNNDLASVYTEAARDICQRYNVPLLELSGVTKKGNHPDVAGMVTIKNQLINFLKTI